MRDAMGASIYIIYTLRGYILSYYMHISKVILNLSYTKLSTSCVHVSGDTGSRAAVQY